MARPKSVFHQYFTFRRMRWEMARRVIGPIGPLARGLNFYRQGVTPAAAASEILEDRRLAVAARFSEAQRAMVRDLCRASDADAAGSDATGEAEFVLRTGIVRDAEVLGHTGAVVVPGRSAILWPSDTAPNWNVSKARRLRRLPAIEGRAVTLGATNHYYHFLMNDMLPLIDYLDRLHPAGTPLHLVAAGPAPSFVATTLHALMRACPWVDVVRVGVREKLPVAELVTLERRTRNREWFVWDKAPVERLKAILLDAVGHARPDAGAEKLFITRGDARVRRLVNESRLVAIAETRGFTVFEPRSDNFAEQIRRFDAARQVVAVHGASLTNLLWGRPDTRVLEIFPGSFVKSTYLWLADRMGMRHHALVGGPGDPLQSFSADADDFARALDALDGA